MGFFSDLEETEVPVKKKGFFSDLPEEVSRTRSLLSAFPKGLIRGGKQLSQLQDPISSAISSFAKNKPDLEEELSQSILPTQRGQFPEDILETAGELAPSFAMGPGGFGAKAAQVAAGSISKNVLKQIGAPELVQDIGAGVGSAIPGGIKAVLSKKINPSVAQKEVYEMLKGHGFSDKQITPFIQSKKKSDILAKWAKPFLSKDRLEKQGKPISETIYESIKQRGESLSPLEGSKKVAFLKAFDSDLKDIPYFFKDSISKDIGRLKSSPLDWKSLRDFELAINNKIKGAEGGKEVLGKLKNSIGLGERMLSQDLFNEKQLMNKAYSQQKNLLKKLSKTELSHLVNYGEMAGIVGGLLHGNPISSTLMIKKGLQLGLSRYLVSPRFQGMQRKLLESVKKNNEGAVLNISTKMLEELDKFMSEKSVVPTDKSIHNEPNSNG